MDIGAIKARIAELEQRKAERNALRGYRDLSYLDYMTKGDRSGFDKIEADEVAYRNMLSQQKFQEQQRALDRELSRELANTANSTNRSNDDLTQKEYEFALIEHDAAKEKMDKDDPDAIANFKRTANKVNYWGKHLPAEMNFEPIVIPEEFEDSKSVRISKKVKTAKNLMARQGKNWRDEDVASVEALITDPELPDELVVQLSSELANKGEGAETKDRATKAKKERLLNKYNSMTPAQQRNWKRNNPNTAKFIGV